MKRIVWALALWLLLALPSAATTSLMFSAEDYSVDLEIGHVDKAVVASVKFYGPQAQQGILLPYKDWKVEVFDTKRKVLLLRHRGGHSAAPAFVLSVQGNRTVLTIGKRRMHSSANWEM